MLVRPAHRPYAVEADPELTRYDLATACVTGEAAEVARRIDATRRSRTASADPNETYQDGNTGEALYHAVEFPDPTCAQLLIEAGALPDQVSSCLGRALDFPNPAIVRMLLAHGATPHGRHLRKAVYKRRPVQTVEALLDAGAPVNEVDEKGMTPLRIAVQWGLADLADLMMARGADPSLVTDADRALGTILAGSQSLDGVATPIPRRSSWTGRPPPAMPSRYVAS